jgi:hypothetical protein
LIKKTGNWQPETGKNIEDQAKCGNACRYVYEGSFSFLESVHLHLTSLGFVYSIMGLPEKCNRDEEDIFRQIILIFDKAVDTGFLHMVKSKRKEV